MKVAILGGGESGIGAAMLAVHKGYEVFLSDGGVIKEANKKVLWNKEIEFEEGEHSVDRITEADVVVKSPGIPNEAEVVRQVEKKGEWISEVEFAAQHTRASLVGITGTNGKTTTTLLTHHILEKAGLDVAVAGNMGKSFARVLSEGDHEVFVLELSSFQLEGIREMKPKVAVILNITPDHLERHGMSMREYLMAKLRIGMNQDERDFLVYNADDKELTDGVMEKQGRGHLLPISLKKPLSEGAYIKQDAIHININQEEKIMSIHELALQGQHNTYNSMAASVAARVFEIRKEIIRESLSDFQNAEHRLEFVQNVHGITYVNDSKATNVNATWYALENYEGPIIWIVGGVDKGNDYSSLQPLVRDKVRAIICMTKESEKIHEAFGDVVDTIVDADGAYQAVAYSYRLGKKGDTVLLSPACASFDLFDDYEDRGKQFKSAVRAL